MPATYTTTELQRNATEVLKAAREQPVIISQYGEERFVMMSRDHYEKMRGEDPRRAVNLDTMTPADAAEILAAAAEHFAARSRGE